MRVYVTGKGAEPPEKTRVWPRVQVSRSSTPLLPAIPLQPNDTDRSMQKPRVGGKRSWAVEGPKDPRGTLPPKPRPISNGKEVRADYGMVAMRWRMNGADEMGWRWDERELADA